MSREAMPSTIATIGIDIGKNTFHLVGLDQRGAIVLQLKVLRAQLERRLVKPFALSDQHGGVFRGAPYWPTARSFWSRGAADPGAVREGCGKSRLTLVSLLFSGWRVFLTH